MTDKEKIIEELDAEISRLTEISRELKIVLMAREEELSRLVGELCRRCRSDAESNGKCTDCPWSPMLGGGGG